MRLCTVAAAMLVFGIYANAESPQINSVYLNDVQIASVTSNDEIRLSARDFFESAGLTVQWFDDDDRVTAYDSGFRINMFNNDRHIYVGKTGYPTKSKMMIIDGVFTIPLDTAVWIIDGETSIENDALYITSSFVRDTEGWEYEVFNLVNREREKYGLDKFLWNSDLTYTAEKHCEDMAVRGYFSHNTPEGVTPFERMRDAGINYTVAAENIAAGQPDPESVVRAWMESDEHRSNILNPNLEEIGIAFSRGGKYGIYWVQEFATTM